MAAPRNSPARVIDLTGEDDNNDDLSRAVKASLETSSGPQFGPSQRPAHPDWAVVPSNACLPDLAIRLSLTACVGRSGIISIP